MTPQEKEKLEKLAEEIKSYHACYSGDCAHDHYAKCHDEFIQHSLNIGYVARDAELNEREKILIEEFLKYLFDRIHNPDFGDALKLLEEFEPAKEKA